MAWTLWQFREIFTSFYNDECNDDLRVCIDNRLDQLVEKGNAAREPISKFLGDGIFELKAKNARMLYFFSPGQRIIFVVAFFKNQRKTPKEELKKAKRHKEIIEAERELASGIYHTH